MLQTRYALVTGVHRWALPIYEAYRLAGIPYGRTELQRMGHERWKAKRAGETPRETITRRWPELASRFSDDDLLECLRRLQKEHGYVTAQIIRDDELSPKIGRASCRERVCQYV